MGFHVILKDFGVIYEKNNLTNSWIILTSKVISGSEFESNVLSPTDTLKPHAVFYILTFDF